MSEAFDDVIREFIDFTNKQVGVYMDALAGFAGNRARVERQIHRANRPAGVQTDPDGRKIVVWASYEDPSKPDIIHNRIARVPDYLADNSEGGFNEQQHARGIIVFLFTYWEDEIRPRLASAKGVTANEIRSDIMGDLRELRHSILHAKGIAIPKYHKKLKKLQGMIEVDRPIMLSHDVMHQIFVLVKQDLMRLTLEWLGEENAPFQLNEIKDIAIQRTW